MPMKETRRGYGSAGSGSSDIPMGPGNYFKLGDWRAMCQQCGQRHFHASQLMMRWDNLWVCHSCYEIRNPQDFVKGVPDGQSPPWTSPPPAPTFVSGSESTGNGPNDVIDGSDTSVGGPMPG